MTEILHKILVRAEPSKVYQALSTVEGLAAWWTTTTTGDSNPGGSIDFRFGDHVTSMRVDTSEPEQQVAWTCVDSHPDWSGTRVSFDLEAIEGGTVVRFGHHGWAEAGDFFAQCSMKWATFLLSMQQLVETGEGRPFPNDIAV